MMLLATVRRVSACHFRRFSSSVLALQQKNALILGVYTKEEADTFEGTRAFQKYDGFTSGKLSNLLQLAKTLKPGSSRVYFGTEKCPIVSVVSLGERNPPINNECLDTVKENLRIGIGAGMRSLKNLGIESVEVDVADDPIAAAEGAFLSSWNYKHSEREKLPSVITPINKVPDSEKPLYDKNINQAWEEGKILAEGQNFARYLMETPANLMTPTIFANTVKEKLESYSSTSSIQVNIHNQDWISAKKMGAFLSVAQGSSQSPKFLEICYTGPATSSGSAAPLVLVGKGITFDSGGISIKPSSGMEVMRADMGGAATVTSAIMTAARLGVPGQVIGLIPLCENLINGHANKPGDVVTAMDGTTIQIENTDAEGRLILADALCYAKQFNPAAILDVATLTGAIIVALGAGATGVFSNCDEMWTTLNQASHETGDRVWRMPLYDLYSSQVKPSHLADISNIGKADRAGGSCTAAAFLNHFVEKGTKWSHLDICGVMENNKQEVKYMESGMPGRPTRTLAEFVRRFMS